MKFKVGDKVKAITNKYTLTSKDRNWEGIFVKVHDYGFNAITVRIDSKVNKNDINFIDLPYNDFEIVESNPLIGVEILVKEFINENKEKFDMVDFKYEIKAKKPILDDTEKEYLKNVIKPFRDRIVYIKKEVLFDQEYIYLYLGDDTMSFPSFKPGTMYKGMKSNKHYTLKELEL